MPLLDLFFAMLWFFLWVAWLALVIWTFVDIFRSDDLGGWAKALWCLFVIFLPFLGVFVYLIARGSGMQRRAAETAAARDAAQRDYIASVAAGSADTAEQLAKLSELHDNGALTDAEFAAGKAKLLDV